MSKASSLLRSESPPDSESEDLALSLLVDDLSLISDFSEEEFDLVL